jgi:hypothetical protein
MHIATRNMLIAKKNPQYTYSTKTISFRRKKNVLHCNMYIARRNMHIANKYRSMHIARKKLEISSPNEQTWPNTFHRTLGVRN